MMVDMNVLAESKEFKDFGNYLQKTYKFSNEQIISITSEIHKLIRKKLKKNKQLNIWVYLNIQVCMN